MKRVLRAAIALCLVAGRAPADDVPPPSRWARRAMTVALTERAVRVSTLFRDVLAPPAIDKLASGLLHTLTVRVALHDETDGRLVAASARTCRIRFDLWDEVYRVQAEAPGDSRNLAFLAVDGVARQCAELRDFALTLRAPLVGGRGYFVAVRGDLNPVDPEMTEHLRRWVTGASPSRPAGDTFFGSVMGIFLRDFAKSERTVLFRGATISP